MHKPQGSDPYEATHGILLNRIPSRYGNTTRLSDSTVHEIPSFPEYLLYVYLPVTSYLANVSDHIPDRQCGPFTASAAETDAPSPMHECVTQDGVGASGEKRRFLLHGHSDLNCPASWYDNICYAQPHQQLCIHVIQT